MIEIPLTQGKVALIDEEDLPIVQPYKWHAKRIKGHWYAATGVWEKERRRMRSIFMHRLLTNAPPRVPVDHRTSDGLDNRRSNLRIAGYSGNARNRRRRGPGAFQYRGARKAKGRTRWRATIQVDGMHIYLGSFATEIEAAHAYDAAARFHFGEYAVPNFPDQTELPR